VAGAEVIEIDAVAVAESGAGIEILARCDAGAVAARVVHGEDSFVLVAEGSITDAALVHELNAALVDLALGGDGTDARGRITRHDRAHAGARTVQTAGWALGELPGGLGSVEQLVAAAKLGRRIPEAAYDALVEFRVNPPSSGALLVRGVDVGEIGPTPETPLSPAEKDRVSEAALLACGSVLGHIVGYAPELGGRVVQNLCPTRDGATRQVSTSSLVELEFHTEAAFHPHRPRYLLLLCLRGDPSAQTTLASIRELVGRLSIDAQRVLREPRFATMVDESYLGHRPGVLGLPRCVISGDAGRETMVFDGDLMHGLDEEAAWALDELRAAIRACQTGVVLEAGDLLVVDNTIAVHGRSPFKPRFDGTDRWLQRTFVLADVAEVPLAGRVVDVHFVG
jgi:hypothetical protein